MDVNYDGDIENNLIVDITFVLLALAKKYRFLTPADASGALLGVSVSGCAVTVTARLRDDANA